MKGMSSIHHHMQVTPLLGHLIPGPWHHQISITQLRGTHCFEESRGEEKLLLASFMERLTAVDVLKQFKNLLRD
ncbi:hypothetical protein BTVI_26069 [Pitangus sulphuratus]|nr:hypothetical protein BTVI_26069 [Pitangus sulphuratus]